MESEKKIRERIQKVTDGYKHVLDCGPATVQVNAPRALLQVEAVAQLDALYRVIGEKRPRFKCDDSTKADR